MSRLPPIGGEGRARRVAAVVALALGQALAAGVVAFATRDVFAALREGAAPAAPLAAIAAGGAAIALLRVAERTVAERLGCDYAAAVREKLFLRIARTPPSEMARRRSGALALRFVGDLSAVRGWAGPGLARLIAAGVALPTSVAVLFLLEPRLALPAAVVLAAALGAMLALSRPLATAHRRLRRDRSRLATAMTERLSHGAALRLIGRVGRERALLATRSARLADRATARARLSAAARAVPDAAGGLAACAVLAAAAAGDTSVATAAGALAALGLAIQPMRQLAEVTDRRQAWRVACVQLERALAAPALPMRREAPRAPRPDRPAIELDRVALDQGATAHGALAAGAVARLAGGDAASRRRLMLAIAGIEDPVSGRIRVFGRAPAALPSAVVGYVGPETPILRGAIARTLRLAAPRADDAALLAALARVGLDPLVERLGGLEARIAEHGADLRPDERSRLRAAQALLGEPGLRLLDGEGLQLDAQTLHELVAALRRKGGATLVNAPAVAPGARRDRISIEALPGSAASPGEAA